MVSARADWRLPLVTGACLVIAVLGMVASGFIYQALYANRIYPGVRVVGLGLNLDLSGETREHASFMIGSYYDRYLKTPLVFRYQGREWSATPLSLGARVELDPVISSAFMIGRGEGLFNRLQGQALFLNGGIPLPAPRIVVDQNQASAYVQNVSREIDRSSTIADLALKSSGNVVILPSQQGLRVNNAKNIRQIVTAIECLSSAPISIIVEDVQSALVEGDLSDVKKLADKILSTPLTLSANLPEGQKMWRLEPNELARFIDLKLSQSDPPRYELKVDDEQIRRQVEIIAPEIERAPKNARFQMDVATGVATPLRESVSGRRLEVTASIALIRDALTSEKRDVVLPWLPLEPRFPSSAGVQSVFPDLIARASTAYGGTLSERMHNVELATQRINGVVIAPGDSFSFNDEVGEVSYKSGYKKGYGISRDGDDVVTIPSEGGGICQVATTLFQAVFWAGYPIVERNWHLYWIPRYGERPRGLKGLDATIDQVYDKNGNLVYAIDLRWRNNTEAPILLVAHADGKDVSMSLWGLKPDWQVKVAEPKIEKVVKADTRPVRQYDSTLAAKTEIMVEHAEDGFQSTITRTISRGSALITETRFESTYRPSRNVYAFGGPQPKVTPAPQAPTPVTVQDRPATPVAAPTETAGSVITPLPTVEETWRTATRVAQLNPIRPANTPTAAPRAVATRGSPTAVPSPIASTAAPSKPVSASPSPRP